MSFFTPGKHKARKTRRAAKHYAGAGSVVKGPSQQESQLAQTIRMHEHLKALSSRISKLEKDNVSDLVVVAGEKKLDTKDSKDVSTLLLTDYMTKAPSAAVPKMDLLSLARVAEFNPAWAQRIRRSRQGEKVRVWIPNAELNLTSAQNTAYNTVTTLLPLNQAEAKTYASVYDTARCVGFKWKIIPNVTSAAAVPSNPTLVAHGAMAYDPLNGSTGYSSVVSALAAKAHYGPFQMQIGPLFTGIPHPPWQYVKIPHALDPGISADLMDSEWVASTDTSTIVGYLKPYMEACGATLIGQLNVFILYDMEFKQRS